MIIGEEKAIIDASILLLLPVRYDTTTVKEAGTILGNTNTTRTAITIPIPNVIRIPNCCSVRFMVHKQLLEIAHIIITIGV
jgi:hypothetical protein